MTLLQPYNPALPDGTNATATSPISRDGQAEPGRRYTIPAKSGPVPGFPRHSGTEYPTKNDGIDSFGGRAPIAYSPHLRTFGPLFDTENFHHLGQRFDRLFVLAGPM